MQLCYKCFSLLAIEEIKSSSAFVFCFGGNLIGGVGPGSFDLVFLSDLEDEGRGGI